MIATPTSADSNATITVNGGTTASGSASGVMNLSVGANPINVIVTAQDGVTTKTYTVTVRRQTVQETWRFTYYGTTGNAADAADPYHTGVQNLAVFAVLGPKQDPAKVATGHLPRPLLAGANYGISFTEPTGVSGVTYGAEWRADLATGNWQAVTDTGSGNVHTFSVPIGSHTQIFMHLTVSSP